MSAASTTATATVVFHCGGGHRSRCRRGASRRPLPGSRPLGAPTRQSRPPPSPPTRCYSPWKNVGKTQRHCTRNEGRCRGRPARLVDVDVAGCTSEWTNRMGAHGGRGKGQGDDGGKGDLGGCGKLLAGLGQEGGGGARRLPVVMVTMKGATGKGSPPQKNGRPAPPPGYRCSPGGAAAALCARCRRRGGTGWPPWQPGDPKKPPHERNGGSVGKRPSPLRRGR